MLKKIIYFLPSILIMAVIFYLSSQPSTGIQGTLLFQFLIHKTLHILVYALLSISFYYAFSKSTSLKTKKIFVLSIILTFIYGLTDEIHQYFVPGRGAKITDTLFDLFGAFIGIYFLKLIHNYQPSTHPNR